MKSDPASPRQSFIGGRWTSSVGAEVIDVINPATEQAIGSVALATPGEADAAVRAARDAFEGWSTTPSERRMELLTGIVEEMLRRRDDLTRLLVSEVGMPISAARASQVDAAIAAFADAVAFLPQALEEEVLGNTLIVAEPVGVVVGITPWNFPLYQLALKVAPALAAGCTVVLKPSEVTPLNALALAEIFEAVGAPKGIFNVVVGRGDVVGTALVRHPLVDMVSLTGSTHAGKAVAAAASETLKKVTLELGGKSPLIVLDDADIEAAVRYGVKRCFVNSGQTCAALTRLLIPIDKMELAESIAAEAVTEFTVGDPMDEASTLGPLVSAVQRDRVRAYINRGIEEGAKLVIGGAEAPDANARGWYVRPTVFSEVAEHMDIAREEIFGPVLVIMGYSDEADAIRIANSTSFGLAAGVYGNDLERIRRVSRHIRSGCVFLGNATPNPQAPFGGVKQSGYGRERGLHGIKEYLSPKALIGAVAPSE